MSDVTVEAKDLEALVQLLLEREVQVRSYKQIFLLGAPGNPVAAENYRVAVEKEHSKSFDMVRPRFQALLNALRSGNNVPQALGNFLARGAKSSAGSDR
jgi:hypothetical protein